MRVKVFTDGFEGYAKRSLGRAKKLSERKKIEPEMSITFENPLAMAEILTPERMRLFQATRTGAFSVTRLATELKRDPKAVRRDVDILESFGLLRTHLENNPGHGRVRIVEPAAKKVELRVAF
jgi:predicted transcriptional regulator